MPEEHQATSTEPLDLRGLTRPVEQTYERTQEAIPDGQYTQSELVSLLSQGWIPFMECHKCGWWETCPYAASPHPANPQRSLDIQCGLAIEIIRNYLRAWWPKLLSYEREDQQHLIDALFHLVQHVLDSHLGLGTLLTNWDPDWWGPDMAAHLSASPLRLRPDLEALAYALQKVPFGFWKRYVAFVEGEAEKEFLQVLKNRRQLMEVDRIEVLGGKGNATPGQIPLRLLHNQGYSVTLQLDRDGSEKKSYRDLEESVRKLGGTVFIFKQDFESAFPAPILATALADTLDTPIDVRWLEVQLAKTLSGGILAPVQQKYGQKVSKVELARALADIVDEELGEMRRDWPDNEIVRWINLLETGQESITKPPSP